MISKNTYSVNWHARALVIDWSVTLRRAVWKHVIICDTNKRYNQMMSCHNRNRFWRRSQVKLSHQQHQMVTDSIQKKNITSIRPNFYFQTLLRLAKCYSRKSWKKKAMTDNGITFRPTKMIRNIYSEMEITYDDIMKYIPNKRIIEIKLIWLE